ncbi:hypothetical protein [Natronorubrum sp. DTA7]|uniref:hypothetical protein n=1 Tax=Natronorubrum sp. DTA7 TaxID=3447016 RepID=UPI003F84A701
MIFLANRANLDRRTVLRRIHTQLQTQATTDGGPIERVWYQTSVGNKVGVRATVDPSAFLDTAYPIDEAELQVTFDFPPDREYDFYAIQWVESERALMLGWHQDETYMDLGACHFQIDYGGETVQRNEAPTLDMHPLNVFDQRTDHLPEILDSLDWDQETPFVPESAVR